MHNLPSDEVVQVWTVKKLRQIWLLGRQAGLHGEDVSVCPVYTEPDSKFRNEWQVGWYSGRVSYERRCLTQSIWDERGNICDLNHWSKRDWRCLGTGAQTHEVFVTRGMVPGARRQLELGIFCKENCVFLCPLCHNHAAQRSVRMYLLRKQRGRGYELDDRGLWEAIRGKLTIPPEIIVDVD